MSLAIASALVQHTITAAGGILGGCATAELFCRRGKKMPQEQEDATSFYWALFSVFVYGCGESVGNCYFPGDSVTEIGGKISAQVVFGTLALIASALAISCLNKKNKAHPVHD